jgi:hypothetical protein
MKELNDVESHPHPGFQTQETVRAHKGERVVKRTVDKIYSSLAANCPHLTVVVLKVDGRTVEMWEDDGTHPFLRSKQIDLHGQTNVVGMAVEWHMVKHYEPCSEILQRENFGFSMLQ